MDKHLLIEAIQIDQIVDTQKKILERLEKLNPADQVAVEVNYIPRKRFMSLVGIGETKFAELQKPQHGGLKTRRVGGKVYVEKTEVNRFFNGDIK